MNNSSGNYLQRYLQGDCVAVWDELGALGDRVREEPFYSDAWAVAQETMRRVRYNFELVIPRLRALGYVFIHDEVDNKRTIPDDELEWTESNPPLYSKPPSDIIKQLDSFEREVATLPLSLRAFYQEVGSFNFTGWYKGKVSKKNSFINELPMEGFDPIVVYGFNRDLVETSDEWMYPDPETDNWLQIGIEHDMPSTEENYKESYTIVVAPDSYHKMNISGGSPYLIQIPNLPIDAPLLYEWHNTTFINYLRICCQYAGLPGLEMLQCQLSEKLDDLRAGMLPI